MTSPVVDTPTPIPAPTPTPSQPGDETGPRPQETGTFSQWFGGAVSKGVTASAPAAAIALPSAGVGVASAIRSGDIQSSWSVGRRSVGLLAASMPKITPALIFGIAGPGVADGVSLLAPNLVKPYKKDMSTKDKEAVKVQRGAAAGVATTGVAAGVWWRKPDLFTKKDDLFRSFVGATPTEMAAFDARHADVLATQGEAAAASLTKPVWNPKNMQSQRIVEMGTTNLRGLVKGVGYSAALGIGGIATAQALRGEGDAAKDLAKVAAGAAVVTMVAGAMAGRFGKNSAVAAARTGAGGVSGIKMPKLSPEFVKWVKSFASIAAPVSVVPAASAAYAHHDVQDAFGNLVNGKKKTPPTRRK